MLELAAPAADLKTFNIGFNEPSYDELAYAEEVARHLQATHATETLDLSVGIADLSALYLGGSMNPWRIPPSYRLTCCARFARRHVTVALSGDGGDELFAGYDPFDALRPASLYNRWVPSLVHKGIRKLTDFLPRSNKNMSFDFKVRRALLGLSFPQSLWNPIWLSPMSPELIREVFELPLSAEELYSEALELWHERSSLSLVDKTLEILYELLSRERYPHKGRSCLDDEFSRIESGSSRQRAC